jgi:hypothetical protein
MIAVAIIENDAITIIKFKKPDGWNKTNKIGPSAASPRLIPSITPELNRTLNNTSLFLKVLKLKNFLDECRVLLFASNDAMPKVIKTELADGFSLYQKPAECFWHLTSKGQ